MDIAGAAFKSKPVQSNLHKQNEMDQRKYILKILNYR